MIFWSYDWYNYFIILFFFSTNDWSILHLSVLVFLHLFLSLADYLRLDDLTCPINGRVTLFGHSCFINDSSISLISNLYYIYRLHQPCLDHNCFVCATTDHCHCLIIDLYHLIWVQLRFNDRILNFLGRKVTWKKKYLLRDNEKKLY